MKLEAVKYETGTIKYETGTIKFKNFDKTNTYTYTIKTNTYTI